MIVAFEGMDGVGKSSVAQLFAKENNFRHESQKITTLLDVDADTFKGFVKRIRTSRNKQLSAVFYIFRCMLDNDEPDINTVVERTIASLYYFEKNNLSEDIWKHVVTLGTVPELIFVLYASPQIRYKRIHNRDQNDADLHSTEALSDGYSDMIGFYKKYNIPYIGINTENTDLERVAEICSDIYSKYSKLGTTEDRIDFIDKMNKIYGFDQLYSQKTLVYKPEEKNGEE